MNIGLGSMISDVTPASVSTYAWSSSEPRGCSATRRYPWVWPAPMIISTSGRFSDSSPAVAAGAGAERLERLNVLADAVGELATGQRGVTQMSTGLVLLRFSAPTVRCPE